MARPIYDSIKGVFSWIDSYFGCVEIERYYNKQRVLCEQMADRKQLEVIVQNLNALEDGERLFKRIIPNTITLVSAMCTMHSKDMVGGVMAGELVRAWAGLYYDTKRSRIDREREKNIAHLVKKNIYQDIERYLNSPH